MISGAVKIPRGRLGVIIGKDGTTKREFEKMAGIKLDIDSSTGIVTVTQSDDPMLGHQAVSVLRAIGRGFSPEKALRLLDLDYRLVIVSLRDYARSGSRRMAELRGRVIGTSGRTRRIIEDITTAYISVYGDTVSILGDYIAVDYASRAVMMIIRGAKHRTVYRYLERASKEIRFRKLSESF